MSKREVIFISVGISVGCLGLACCACLALILWYGSTPEFKATATAQVSMRETEAAQTTTAEVIAKATEESEAATKRVLERVTATAEAIAIAQATEVARPTDTPTLTQVATPTSVPTSTSTLLPTPTKTSTAVPTVEPIDLSKLEALLHDVYPKTPKFTTSEGLVEIVVDTTPSGSFGDELHGIELAEKAELYAYAGIYFILDEFEQVDTVITEILFEGESAYRVGVTREEAYKFRPGTFGSKKPTFVDPDTLVLTAIEQNLISSWNIQYLAPQIEKAIVEPSAYDITAIVASWIAGEVLEASIESGAVSVKLDLSELAHLFYDTYGSDDPVAKEEVEFEAALNTADTLYGLFIRFPTTEDITVEVYIDGERYSAHRCTRQQFNEIGPGMFFLGGPNEDPLATLKLLASP